MEIIHSYGDLDYIEMDRVYPVKEDTLFLAGELIEILMPRKGRLMDMGCGVGLNSLLASVNGWDVVSVDREPMALLNVRRNLELNGLRSRTMLSDLFHGIPLSMSGSFDIIAFNPPYLPSDGIEMDRRSDLALVGGRKGLEVVERFLRESSRFLKDQGRIILLGYEKWSEEIRRYGNELTFEGSNDSRKDIDGEQFTIFTWLKQ